MSLNCGIVGLPNVGKSTLFNALTSTQKAQSANYPFCTIEPNKGIVSVPDERLQALANIAGSKNILPTRLEFIDIAGLVKGASKGEGLGNQFLSNIRETDAIIHVVRCFDDSNIIHVEETVDPVRDAEIVNTELMLADLEALEKRIVGLEKKAKTGDKEAKEQADLINKILPVLHLGKMAYTVEFTTEEQKTLKSLFLITSKPVLYVCNVNENDVLNGNKYVDLVKEYAKTQNAPVVIICAKIEEEIANLEQESDKIEYLETLGLQQSGLDKIIKEGYNLLKLQTYFTVGPKETRAWTIKQNTNAQLAAGEIHSDIERGFIAAEVISYSDYISLGGEVKAKEQGKVKIEGKTYIVKDGDVILFRFNV
jgi:GTP-binding protein YchF